MPFWRRPRRASSTKCAASTASSTTSLQNRRERLSGSKTLSIKSNCRIFFFFFLLMSGSFGFSNISLAGLQLGTADGREDAARHKAFDDFLSAQKNENEH